MLCDYFTLQSPQEFSISKVYCSKTMRICSKFSVNSRSRRVTEPGIDGHVFQSWKRRHSGVEFNEQHDAAPSSRRRGASFSLIVAGRQR